MQAQIQFMPCNTYNLNNDTLKLRWKIKGHLGPLLFKFFINFLLDF